MAKKSTLLPLSLLLLMMLLGFPDPARADLGEITGRYRHVHDNGDINGRFFKSTDILSIERLDKSTITVSALLVRFNGHTCSLNERFNRLTEAVYVLSSPDYPKCQATLQITQNKFIFFDATQCMKHEMYLCGMRAGFDEAYFYRKDKQP